MILRKLSLSLGLTALLAGCGNAPEMGTGLATSVSLVQGLVQAQRAGAQAQPLQPTAGFPGLDPALIAGRTDPTLGAYLPSRAAVSGLMLVGRNGPHATWHTADQIALVLYDGGVVASTRGLGPDLHASDVSQSAALIAAGEGGTAERRMVFMDGHYRPRSLWLTCTVTPQGSEVLVLNGRRHAVLRLDESCTGRGQSFTNTYWRDAHGPVIRQSTQWLGPNLGVIHLQRLID